MNTTATSTVVGVFDDRATAQNAVDDLVNSGFDRSKIEVTSHDSFASDAASGNTGMTGEMRDTSGGGIGGFFRRLFGDDVRNDERGHFAEAVRRGSSVVCVTTDEQNSERAADILDSRGAVDIDTRASSWRQQGYSGFDESAKPLSTDEVYRDRESYRSDSGDRSIPVVQEEMQIGKRSVQRGGVRIYNRVVEQPVEEQINLREERVTVDRRSVDRPATEADLQGNDVIEVTEMAEEPVIGKTSRVVEEVVVGKETVDRQQTIRDSVRRTDVNVERLGAESTGGSDYDTDSYDYGYRMASDDRYRGRRWEDVESHLRTDYERQYPNSKWEQMKHSVRHGWEKVTGRA